jgi:hypothetical protein
MTKRGLLEATDDPNQVEWWWSRTPDANIGLRTGIAFDVLDLDGPEGLASLTQIAPGYKHDGPVGATGKGFHLLFGVTGKRNFANPMGKESATPGIDFRGDGGYIVAAPSIHPNGHAYRWHRPAMLPLPAAPAWLWDLFPKPVAPAAGPNRMAEVARGLLDTAEEMSRLGVILRPAGGGLLKGLCPFHKEDTPSLVVYPDDRGFFCFGCNEWGDALNLVRYQREGRLR